MQRLYDLEKQGPMKIVIFMSTPSGSNATKILELEKSYRDHGKEAPFKTLGIIADREHTKAPVLAEQFGIKAEVFDLEGFARVFNKRKSDRSIRPAYFEHMMDRSQFLEYASAYALAGYNVLMPQYVFDNMCSMVFNVHPADLSIRDASGNAIFVGEHAVRDSIAAGQREIRSSTHIVTEGMDQGPVLLVSKPVEVVLPDGITAEMLRKPENSAMLKEIADAHQDTLKRVGDWEILPRTLVEVARGNIALGFDNTPHYWYAGQWLPIPRGYDVAKNEPR